MLPPVPSDAAVALGSFLSHRHVTTPLAVFLVTWIANLLGAAGVYLAAGEAERSISSAEQALREMAALPQSQQSVAERDWLNQILLEVQAARNAAGDQSTGRDALRDRHTSRTPN